MIDRIFYHCGAIAGAIFLIYALVSLNPIALRLICRWLAP